MKKTLFPILATGTIMVASLLPFGIRHAVAASYYPDYTCYYRDISGSCLRYQTSTPYFPSTTTRSLYGNRQTTYPFTGMFNAYSVTPSPWDNRQSNRANSYYLPYNPFGEDDTNYRYYSNIKHHPDDGRWKMYMDNEDGTYHPYRYQSHDWYDEENGYDGAGNRQHYYEYENTRVYCSGRDCDTQHIRY